MPSGADRTSYGRIYSPTHKVITYGKDYAVWGTIRGPSPPPLCPTPKYTGSPCSGGPCASPLSMPNRPLNSPTGTQGLLESASWQATDWKWPTGFVLTVFLKAGVSSFSWKNQKIWQPGPTCHLSYTGWRQAATAASFSKVRTPGFPSPFSFQQESEFGWVCYRLLPQRSLFQGIPHLTCLDYGSWKWKLSCSVMSDSLRPHGL